MFLYPKHRLIALALSLMFFNTPTNVLAYSNATKWLMKETIKNACPSKKGRFHKNGVIEIDLDGDHRRDLILKHSSIECYGETRSSGYCGAALCQNDIYLRRGKLLKLNTSFYGEIEIIKHPKPILKIDGFKENYQLRWSSGKFRRIP